MAIKDISLDVFEEEVINSDITVLVDFFATWCAPCHMMEPAITELSREYDGKVKVCQIDVDKEPELSMRFNIMFVPTLIVFKNGEMTAKSEGYCPKADIEKMIS